MRLNEQTFSDWLLEVDRIFKEDCDPAGACPSGANPLWRGMYDDGMTPGEALDRYIDGLL